MGAEDINNDLTRGPLSLRRRCGPEVRGGGDSKLRRSGPRGHPGGADDRPRLQTAGLADRHREPLRGRLRLMAKAKGQWKVKRW